MTDRRYLLDDDVQRHPGILIGGSPLKLFRLTVAGDRIVDEIAAGDEVGDSPLVTSLLDAGAIHPIVAGPGRFTDADVTIVVPTLDPPRHVPTGAVLVDDGSDPPVPSATLRLDTNRGPGAARNAGLALVKTDLVAFVDADVALHDGWLTPLLPHFDDDRVALVAPRVISRAGTSRLAAYETTDSPLDLGGRGGRIRAGTRIGYVPAAAVVCRVDALREIGGFDETLRFGEDVDLVWRLDDAGRWLRYEPSAAVLHEPRPSWPAWARQRVAYGSSAAPLARRHPGALAPLRLSGWSVATWVLAVVVHPVVGASIGVGSAGALIRKLPEMPAAAAFRLAGRGNLHAGDQIAAAIRRAWWPLLVLASVRSRRSRVALTLAALAARTPLRLLDDISYSIGVWRGVIRERTVAPLLPKVSSWPGRRSRPQPAGVR